MGLVKRKIMGKQKEKNLSEIRTVNYQHEHNDVIKVGSRKKFDTKNLPISTF